MPIHVEAGGQRVAASRDVLRVTEDDHPARYYFPRNDVAMDLLERSDTVTACPFKGVASYYHLKLADRRIEDAVWSYEDPYDEHRALKGRLAFYDADGIELKIAPAPSDHARAAPGPAP